MRNAFSATFFAADFASYPNRAGFGVRVRSELVGVENGAAAIRLSEQKRRLGLNSVANPRGRLPRLLQRDRTGFVLLLGCPEPRVSSESRVQAFLSS